MFLGGDEFEGVRDWQVKVTLIVLSIIGVCAVAGWVYAFWSLLRPGVAC